MAPSPSNKAVLAMFKCERIRRIVAYLLQHEAEIDAWDTGQLTFDCSGKTLKATKKETERI